MNIPSTTKPEFSFLTCCLCENGIDPKGFYSSYSDTRKAHLSCWLINKAVGHSIRTKPSRFVFERDKETNEPLFIGGSEMVPKF